MVFHLLISACSWANPGQNPYTGDVPSAVDSYTDIPAEVRARLKYRMERRKYDDLAVIRRDSIQGYDTSYSDLRSMHFGKGDVCSTVTRDSWPEKHEEVGLIYCEAGHCLIVPTVCRNVSRVTKIEKPFAVLPPLIAGPVPEQVPPGGYFVSTSEPEFIYAYQPTFRTPAPWIVTIPGPSYFFPVPVLQPVDVVPPAPVVQPPKTVAPPWPPRLPPIAPPTVPEVPPATPVINPPVTTPWTPEPPVSPPVPEPGSWAMVLAGISLITFFNKKKAT